MPITRSMAARLPNADYPYPQLPPEVISIIAEDCDLKAAKTMRFVSSAASYGAAKRVFEKISLQSSPSGINKLLLLASNHFLAQCVHRLNIFAPNNIGAAYLLNVTAEDIALIAVRMKSFRNLRRFCCCFSSQIILGAKAGSSQMILFLKTLLESALTANANFPTKLIFTIMNEFHIVGMDQTVWNELNDFASGALANVRSLELAMFRDHVFLPTQWSHALIAPMLSSCRNIVSLEILRETDFWLNIEGATNTTRYDFPCLRKLSLESIVATGQQLINLISGCKDTLEELRIGRLELAKLEWYPGVAPPASFVAQTASWSDVFEYLMTNVPMLYLFKRRLLSSTRLVGSRDLLGYRMDEHTVLLHQRWGASDHGCLLRGTAGEIISLGKLLIHIKATHKARFGVFPRFDSLDARLIQHTKYTAIYPQRESGPRRQAAAAAIQGIRRSVRLSLLD